MRFVASSLMMAAALFGQIVQRNPIQPVTLSDAGNLPVQKLGVDDLIGVQVYDSPELTRTVRVGRDGTIRLPLIKRRIKAAGLFPQDLETSIADALREEELLVDPVVTVSAVEYRSRPISVVGAVKKPLTFQAFGNITLLEAVSRAEGLSDEAGPELLVSRAQPGEDGKPTMLVQRISIKALIDAADPEVNLRLEGGEEIRVPEVGKVWIMGSVKKPGAYPIRDSPDTSVMKAIALAEGTAEYFGDIAFLYRREGATGGKNEIQIDLKSILARKSPDVTLLPNDLLYIPENTKRKNFASALKTSLPVAAGVGAALIYALTIR
jgi:polysaccharide export outer membrane protein